MATDKADEGKSPDPSLDATPEVVPEAIVETPETDAKPAGSSAADDQDANAESEKKLLDVVKDAVKPVEAAPGDPSDPDKKDPPEAKADADPDKKGEADAEAEVPFHDHPRWKQVLAERDGLKPDAIRARNIDAFMAENGLKPERVAEAYLFMAQLESGDPNKLRQALTALEAQVDALRTQLGETLPDDLQQKVDDKLIDLEDAQEIAKQRASSKLRDAADQRRDERTEAEKSAEGTRKLVADVGDALTKWEVAARGRDPDYAKKADLVETYARNIWQTEGPPKSVEAAIAIADRALEKVNGFVAKVAPAKQAVDTTTPRSSSAPAIAAPKTMREAVAHAVSG